MTMQQLFDARLKQHIEWLRTIDITTYDGPCVTTFRGFNLSGCDMRSAYLHFVDMRTCILKNTNLEDAVLWGADMRGVDLRYARLKRTHFYRANLRGALIRPDIMRMSYASKAQVAECIELALDYE